MLPLLMAAASDAVLHFLVMMLHFAAVVAACVIAFVVAVVAFVVANSACVMWISLLQQLSFCVFAVSVCFFVVCAWCVFVMILIYMLRTYVFPTLMMINVYLLFEHHYH
jgi:hypothetical protein